MGQKTSAKYASIVSQYEGGMSTNELGLQYGVTRQAIWACLKRRGYKPRRGGVPLSPRYSEAANMYAKGISVTALAKYYGVSIGSVNSALHARGVKTHRHPLMGEDNHLYRGGSKKDRRVEQLTTYAIKCGILKPHPCEVCGYFDFNGRGSGVNAHHDDYNKPMTVRWLCRKHHFEWHKNNTAISEEGLHADSTE